jgi:hypothetical protein
MAYRYIAQGLYDLYAPTECDDPTMGEIEAVRQHRPRHRLINMLPITKMSDENLSTFGRGTMKMHRLYIFLPNTRLPLVMVRIHRNERPNLCGALLTRNTVEQE